MTVLKRNHLCPRTNFVGYYLREVRLNKKLTLEMVAADLYCSATAIGNIENTGNGKMKLFATLCAYYELDQETIMTLFNNIQTKAVKW